MVETLVVFGIVGFLAVAGLILPLVPPDLVLDAGFVLIAIGMGFGVPTGFWYHVKLRAALVRVDALVERWWLKPLDHHGLVDPFDRPGMMRWCIAGGIGFGITILGCLGVALGVVLQGLAAWQLLYG